MGVVSQTYRCRMGQSVPHHGAVEMCIISNFNLLLRLFGAVSFIRILLVLAGIEQNPGPRDKFVFRYQYFLIEIGAKVLREIFEVKVGRDFVNYLATNTTANKTLKNLMSGKNRKITAEQEKLLPPIEKNPSSSSFDLTLVCLLLRNVCGLSPPSDLVWKDPLPTDYCLEADITRVRMRRNEMMHIDTLRMSEKDLKAKWQELDTILHRLNTTAGLSNLTTLISDAMYMDIDEELKDRSSDIQKYLVDTYRRCCKTLPVSPLFKNKDENLLDIYKYPTMNSVQRNRDGSEMRNEIKCYEDIFCKDNMKCEEIYLTGDAGVGKSAFCTCMSLLWCYAKTGEKIEDDHPLLQKDVDYMSKFEFLFFVSLRDTSHTHVVDMIIEQLFGNNKEKYQSIIDTIVRERRTLILMDGLDEWMPAKVAANKTHELPDRIHSTNCIYMTTSRPHRLESVRIASKDVDHHIEIMGICGDSSESYVDDVIKYLNRENADNRKVSEFINDVDHCRLSDLLCIPIIASHLVVLWFEGTMTDMPRALIYANILEMLFKRAEMRGVNLPSTSGSKFQHLPTSVSRMKYLNKHPSLLYNVCHLSFRSLFKSETNAPNLVFTVDQLQDEPYCFTVTETEFLCQIGILSKHEVFGCFSVEKLKLSFLHKSYIEFFAALFISSSSDFSKLFDDRWKSLKYVLRNENLILLLVGLLSKEGKVLFENLYQLMSDDLLTYKGFSLFYSGSHSYCLIKDLQTIVIKCFKELGRCNGSSVALRLEDFIFGDDSDVDLDILKQLLHLNKDSVKSLYSDKGVYYDVFDEITNLQILHVLNVDDKLCSDYAKFIKCMLRNRSSLHTVCIKGNSSEPPMLIDLPVKSIHRAKSIVMSLFKIETFTSLNRLTSLCLVHLKMQHEHFLNLVKFLSDNRLFEDIELSYLSCDQHLQYDKECSMNLNLRKHSKLSSLYLKNVNILCQHVNKSSIKFVTLSPFSDRIVSGYVDVLNNIKYSQLKYLDLHALNRFDDETMRTLTAVLKTLPCIKLLRLYEMHLPKDAFLQVHPEVSDAVIEFDHIKMSRQCFHCLVESIVNTKSVIKVELDWCVITPADGETSGELSEAEESVRYMTEYISQIQTSDITYQELIWLHFETTGSQ